MSKSAGSVTGHVDVLSVVLGLGNSHPMGRMRGKHIFRWSRGDWNRKDCNRVGAVCWHLEHIRGQADFTF